MAKHKKSPVAEGESEKSQQLKDWHCILILALMVAAFFHQHLLGNAFLWEDFLYHNYPVRSFAATSMAMGQMPLWNPYIFNGMPFLADIQTTVFYLPAAALMFFVNDGVLNFYWLQLLIILHYVLAGAGMFYLAKSFRLGQIPSLFAGAAYMLSSFMVTHAIHQQIITLVAWFPVCFLFFRNAITSNDWKWIFLAAIVLGHSTLAGYPQLSLYFYCLLGAYFVFEILGKFKAKELLSRAAILMSGKAAMIVALSVAIAMIQLLPTIELSDLSQRAEITYEKSAEGSLTWSQALTFLYPKYFGVSDAHGYSYFGPGPYWYYWETSMYLGVLPFLLLGISLLVVRKVKMVAFLWGVLAFAFLFSLGDNFILHKVFFDFVPGFSTFRNPARMGGLLSLAASMLSAFALHHVMNANAAEKSRMKKTVLVIGGVGAVLWVLTLAGILPGMVGIAKNDQVSSLVRKYANISFVVVAASSAVLVWLIRKKPGGLAPLVLVAFFFVDMYLFGGEQNTAKVNPMGYFGKSSQMVEYFKSKAGDQPFRVNSRNSQGMIMDRNQGMVSRVQTMEGYTPLALQRVYPPVASDTVMHDLLNIRFKTVTNGNVLNVVEYENALPRAFFVYNIHIANDEEGLVEFLRSRAFDHRSTAVLETDPGRTIPSPSDPPVWKTKILNYENNSIGLQAETSSDGFLVLSEIYYPGWNAYVDGKKTEIFRTNYNLRGFFVDKGVHEIEIRFEPESYATGKMITIATLVLSVGGGIVTTRKKKSEST